MALSSALRYQEPREQLFGAYATVGATANSSESDITRLMMTSSHNAFFSSSNLRCAPKNIYFIPLIYIFHRTTSFLLSHKTGKTSTRLWSPGVGPEVHPTHHSIETVVRLQVVEERVASPCLVFVIHRIIVADKREEKVTSLYLC